MDDEIQELLKGLTRGLSQNSAEKVYQYHRKLHVLGSAAIPAISEQILSQRWDEIKYGSQLNILSGLLSLVNDIDEASAKQIGDEIEEQGCNQVVSTRIKSILSFTLKDFHLYEVFDVKAYISKRISETNTVKRKLSHWMSVVPEADLKEIERLYIIPHSCSDRRGSYTPILSSIMVEWILPLRFLYPLTWLFLFEIEKTLYHEIGHHIHDHTFGQIPEQEKQADEYSARLFKKNHPWISKIF